MKYHPYLARGRVANNLLLGLPTAANIPAWKTLLTTQVFVKSFTNSMKHGFNNGLSQTSSVGMTLYSGEWPRSQGDAKKLLFADSMTNMVKGGSMEFRWPVCGCGYIICRQKGASLIG